ncbi:hypothetical protein L1987_57547 [Smallanthus sonchifolius]|uniref:Uncharacterized protein n=1 Tax=Smallanthus sonchifolius TaxID=185202 RepID=A0ACB9DDA9_9ASTR|nr:hypothetical protein L1987_57547 [Smallanthus sonchifolius]
MFYLVHNYLTDIIKVLEFLVSTVGAKVYFTSRSPMAGNRSDSITADESFFFIALTSGIAPGGQLDLCATNKPNQTKPNQTNCRVMTPYYSEETVYSKSDLDMENEDEILEGYKAVTIPSQEDKMLDFMDRPDGQRG